jgi:hypothetical protein
VAPARTLPAVGGCWRQGPSGGWRARIGRSHLIWDALKRENTGIWGRRCASPLLRETSERLLGDEQYLHNVQNTLQGCHAQAPGVSLILFTCATSRIKSKGLSIDVPRCLPKSFENLINQILNLEHVPMEPLAFCMHRCTC